jgi:DNA-binding NarL/FixJ family response regulator
MRGTGSSTSALGSGARGSSPRWAPFRFGTAPGHELAATGEAPAPRADSRLDELTPQELAVATMAARGLTNRDVAATLFLSPKTVEYHLRHVYQKLGLRSRAQLAAAISTASADPRHPGA